MELTPQDLTPQDLTPHDRLRVSEAIREAEGRTDGEIVCVVARSSSDYSFYPVVWAALAALCAPWPLIELTRLTVQRIFILQLVVFIAALLVLSLPRLRMLLVPRPVQRGRAHRAAMEQFVIRGMSRTRERTGVLIFVSLAERYARIVADEGISARVPQKTWQDAVDRLIAGCRDDKIADGLVAAVEMCGAVLARQFPLRADHVNELPDKVYVI